jgi:hypothetical protein
MRRFSLALLVICLAAGQAAAVEVRLRDGTVLEADSYTLTGSFLMLTLPDGRQIAYDVADVDLESLSAQETETTAPPARPSPTLSEGRRKLAMPPEQRAGGLAITDEDVEHVGDSEPGEAEQEGEGETGTGAAEGPPEGFESGGRVVLDDLQVTAQGGDSWLVEGAVINRNPQPVTNVRVQLQTVVGRGQTPWSGEVAVASQLRPNEKGVFSHSFQAAKPEGKVHPDVRASVIWMQHQSAPERPPAAAAAPSFPGATGEVDY